MPRRRPPRVLVGAAAAGAVLLAGACGTRAPSSGKSQEIVGGAPDTVRYAVVAVVAKSGTEEEVCTGTIVKTDPTKRIGWVVTAAHCFDTLPPVSVVVGDDFTRPVLSYRVIDWTIEPRYQKVPGTPYDFAVVRIDQATERTPVIPLADDTTEPLAIGTSVTSVGYGRTSVDPDGGVRNTARRSVTKSLSEVTSEFATFEMAESGFCIGDSGGPILTGSGSSERVVGVHSHVKSSCSGRGVSGQISAARDFFAAELARARPTDHCDTCSPVENLGIGCLVARHECLIDSGCSALYRCVGGGKDREVCAAEHPAALAAFERTERCSCVGLCTTACASEPAETCRTVPACGYAKAAEAPECATCLASHCCEDALALAATRSVDCFHDLGTTVARPGSFETERPAANCATSPEVANLKSCAKTHCAAACLGAPKPDAGASTGEPSTARAEPQRPETPAGSAPARTGEDEASAAERSAETPTNAAPPRAAAGCAASPTREGAPGRPGLLALGLLGLLGLRRRRFVR